MSTILQAIQAVESAQEGGLSSVVEDASLGQRMADEWAKLSGLASTRQANLLAALQSSSSDPQRLLSAQRELANYQIAMSEMASFVRKAVATVETLVKS